MGLLAGSGLTELFSLNVGFAFDIVNLDVPAGADAGRYVLDIGFNPLFHFPLQSLDIVAGPLAGVFVDYGSIGGGGLLVDTWAYGCTVGANAGVLFPVGTKARLGGLADFHLRNPLNALRDGERKGHSLIERSRLGQDDRAVVRRAALRCIFS